MANPNRLMNIACVSRLIIEENTGTAPAIPGRRAWNQPPRRCLTLISYCGTPLYLAYDGRDDFALAVGSLDTPEGVTPTHHYGAEGRLPWARR